MSLKDIQETFLDHPQPSRWDRLVLRDGRLIGDVNLFFHGCGAGGGGNGCCSDDHSPRQSHNTAEVNIFVQKGERACGAGTRALECAVNEARRRDCSALRAIVDDSNSDAVAFFVRSGFVLKNKMAAFNQSEYVLFI
jgi:hypothetical protein